MSSLTVQCPICRSGNPDDWGTPRYRLPARVAGVELDISDLALRHYRCNGCGYQFVFPRVPADRLLACYETASKENWDTSSSHSDDRFYDLKQTILTEHAAGKTVLDLGCFDGGFLRHLGPEWTRLGVEPCAAAAKVAGERGIEVIAPTLEGIDWTRGAGCCDIVTCFDVMEHVEDPVATLQGAARLLRQRGIMMIETGNSDSAHWRLIRKSYWYCGIVEHIGFFNRQSLTAAADRAGFDVVDFRRVRHGRLGLRDRFKGYANFLPYYALRLLARLRFPLSSRLRNIARGTLPCSFCSRDHLLAVLRKRE